MSREPKEVAKELYEAIGCSIIYLPRITQTLESFASERVAENRIKNAERFERDTDEIVSLQVRLKEAEDECEELNAIGIAKAIKIEELLAQNEVLVKSLKKISEEHIIRDSCAATGSAFFMRELAKEALSSSPSLKVLELRRTVMKAYKECERMNTTNSLRDLMDALHNLSVEEA